MEKVNFILEIVLLTVLIIYLAFRIKARYNELKIIKTSIDKIDEEENPKEKYNFEYVADKIVSVFIEIGLALYLAMQLFEKDSSLILKLIDILKEPIVIILFGFALLLRITRIIVLSLEIGLK